MTSIKERDDCVPYLGIGDWISTIFWLFWILYGIGSFIYLIAIGG